MTGNKTHAIKQVKENRWKQIKESDWPSSYNLQAQEEPWGGRGAAHEAEGQQRPAEVPAGLPGGQLTLLF